MIGKEHEGNPQHSELSLNTDTDSSILCGDSEYDSGSGKGIDAPQTPTNTGNMGRQCHTSTPKAKSDKTWGLVIGGSNTRGLQLTDDMPVDVSLCGIGGTKLRDIPDRVDRCVLEPDTVRVVVVHVGSCEWNLDSEKLPSGEEVYREYVEALNHISDKYKQAEIVISSVPPRAPIGKAKYKAAKVNTHISDLNKKLKELVQNEQNLGFVDNDLGLKRGAEVYTDMYKDDIHLNEQGRFILADNLKTGIREGYGKNVLREEWNVAPS